MAQGTGAVIAQPDGVVKIVVRADQSSDEALQIHTSVLAQLSWTGYLFCAFLVV